MRAVEFWTRAVAEAFAEFRDNALSVHPAHGAEHYAHRELRALRLARYFARHSAVQS